MIQANFTFELGDSGDTERIAWLKQDLLKSVSKHMASGNDQSATRDLTRLQKLIGCGSIIGTFVKYSIVAADRKESIATSEAWTAYASEMQQCRQPNISQREFERALARTMRDVHGVAKSRGVSRDGKARNGYFGVKLKTPLSK